MSYPYTSPANISAPTNTPEHPLHVRHIVQWFLGLPCQDYCLFHVIAPPSRPDMNIAIFLLALSSLLEPLHRHILVPPPSTARPTHSPSSSNVSGGSGVNAGITFNRYCPIFYSPMVPVEASFGVRTWPRPPKPRPPRALSGGQSQSHPVGGVGLLRSVVGGQTGYAYRPMGDGGAADAPIGADNERHIAGVIVDYMST